MNDLYNRPYPKTVNINNVFQVIKESSHIGYLHELHVGAESKHKYKKYNDYSIAQRKKISRDIFKHLKQLYKPEIRVGKRVTLPKLRRFVVPEDQDYWMYQDPSSEDVKLEKETSKKERKY